MERKGFGPVFIGRDIEPFVSAPNILFTSIYPWCPCVTPAWRGHDGTPANKKAAPMWVRLEPGIISPAAGEAASP